MSLQYKFFRIPLQSLEESEEALNRFLRSVKVVHVQREFVAQGENSFWTLAIEYMPSEDGSAGGGILRKRVKIDYKELLSPEDFAVFVKLREWRKEVAAEEGVPVYAIFTNEQMAKIAEERSQTQADLAQIDGIGKSRIAKYGESVLEIVAKAIAGAREPGPAGAE